MANDAGYDGSIKINTSVDGSGFNQGVKSILQGLGGIAAAMGVAFSASAIVNFIKQSVNLASGADIVAHRFNTIFGGLSASVKANLEQIGQNTNYCEDELMDFASKLQIVFSGLGYTQKQAAGMSTDLVKVALDLATFNNVDPSQVLSNLQYAMMGYTRGLREYGIAISDATIKEKAQTMGLWDGAGAMSAQAKSAAILQLILDKTTYAQGAAAASTTTWAGQVRGIAVAWEDFTKTLGRGFMTALQGLLPAINWIISILQRAATTFMQLMSILFGMRVEVGATAGGMQGAADAAGDLADQTNAAGKAAKGALAPFDQLNVLQQKQATTPTAGLPTTGLPGINPADFTQTEGLVQKTWKRIVEIVQQAWEIIKHYVGEAWDWIMKNVWLPFASWFQLHVIDPVVSYFSTSWAKISLVTSEALDFIKKTWALFAPWWKANVTDPFLLWFQNAWNNIKLWSSQAWGWISTTWALVASWFQLHVIDPLKLGFSNAWIFISGVWATVSSWFQLNVIDPVRDGFGTALDWISDKWNTTFTDVQTFVKGVINTIIGFINGMLSGITAGINAAVDALNTIHVSIPSWVPNIGGNSFGVNLSHVSGVSIPYLATGAVIPPNAAFLAMLGDQASGKNIEAPEALIRQIINESLDAKLGSQQFSMRFEGSLGQLVKVLKPVIDRENSRVGTNLIRGTVS